MAEHLKALVVIIGLATAVFLTAKAPVCAIATATEEFDRRRNLWFGITLIAFLAHNFWVYIIAASILSVATTSREPNKLPIYFFVLFTVPPIGAQISGFGVIQHFFEINSIRLLSFVILLPAFLSLRSQPDAEPFGRCLPDKILLGHMILNLGLTLSVSSFTNSLRHGVLYSFLDIFLPYYVASRSLREIKKFRDALLAFVVAALVLSAIAIFEYSRHWLLYSSLDSALGVNWGYGNYLARGEASSVRTEASTGQPIPLGYILAVAIGLLLFLKKAIPSTIHWWISLLLLTLGLATTMSRGPWIGAITIFFIFVALGPAPIKNFTKLVLVGIILAPGILFTSAGENIVSHLPFIGNVGSEAVTYRQQLLEVAIEVIFQNPFFGAYDYFYSAAMQDLKQGEGIIDIVNTYLAIGLSSGLVGLTLFSSFFIVIIANILNKIRHLPNKSNEDYLLGQALLSTLAGILVIIATVSSISFIPVIYWSIAGLGVSFVQMINSGINNQKANPPTLVGNQLLTHESHRKNTLS